MTTNILAPFATVGDSFQFYINGRVFEMNEATINEVEGTLINATLRKAIAAFESFEFGTNIIKWFHGASKFTYNLTESKFQHNNSVIEGNTFKNHVLSAGLVRYNESNIADLFESLPTLIENFVSLDFVASFKGNNITVDAFKLNEEIYIARYNKTNSIGKFFKTKNANEALEYIANETGENANLFLEDLLEGQASIIAKNEKNIASYESMIGFLKDQRGILAEANKSIVEIKAADILINSEIEIWENKIAKLKA